MYENNNSDEISMHVQKYKIPIPNHSFCETSRICPIHAMPWKPINVSYQHYSVEYPK
jgi:hypothetical protein